MEGWLPRDSRGSSPAELVAPFGRAVTGEGGRGVNFGHGRDNTLDLLAGNRRHRRR